MEKKPTAAHLAQVYYHLSENWIHTQIAHLNRYEPLILTRKTKNLDLSEDIPCHYALLERPRPEKLFNLVAQKVLGYAPSFYWYLKRRNARLIHAHFGPQGYAAVRLARAAGLPLITTFYGYDLSRLPVKDPSWRTRYAQLFRLGSRFLVEGHHMRQQLVELGCPTGKIRVQHLGIDLTRFPYQPRIVQADEPLRFLAAGRFTEKKGFVYAIEAFARFLAEGGKGELTIIGDAKPGDASQLRTKLDMLTTLRERGLEARVHLRGMQTYEELIKAYYEHHVFLSPSVQACNGDNEGGAPVTLIEASATGMPIVSTTHCDIPEVVRHERTGFLAPERDEEQLAQYLMTFFQHPRRIAEMGRAAHQHIAAEYDARMQGRRLEAIYDHVCSEKDKLPAGT